MIAPLSVTDVAESCHAQLLGPMAAELAISGLAIDSRKVVPGDLFVALPGERVDGHDFVASAFDQGAHAALVQHPVAAPGAQLLVGDTESAVAAFAARVRSAYNGVLVGITGSAGKTTTKNLLASILATAGPVVATEGNQNNELGVPLTLAKLARDTEFAVLEMGAGKPGDIASLCAFTRPTAAVLLNVAPAHLEHFGTLDAISDTKGALLDDLPADGFAVINADQPWANDWRARCQPARCIGFGLQEDADYRAIQLQPRGFSGTDFVLQTPERELAIHLAVPGMQGVYNALAAAAVADALGIGAEGIVEGLAAVVPAEGRGAVQTLPAGRRLVDDCYNANPMAVRAALDVLANESGRRRLVLGAMLELGRESDQLHREIGAYAAAKGIEEFWVVGPVTAPAAEAFGPGAEYFESVAQLMTRYPSFQGADIAVIKASRGARLERIVERWRSAGEVPC